MSKYSTDSDSSERSSRHHRRKKRKSSSSSYSSDDSVYSSKKKSHKHKRSKSHRSRSRDRYSKSRSRYSRDISRSSSRNAAGKVSKGRSRSSSREKYRDRRKRRTMKSGRSPSKGQIKYRSSSSSSNDESGSKSNSSISVEQHASQINLLKQEQSSEDQLKAQLQQAIKAAQSADDLLRQQGFLTGISSRKDDIKEPQVSIIDEINNPSFVPKHFVSQSMMNFQNTASLAPTKTPNIQPQTVSQEVKIGSNIFHPSLMVDADQKLDKWVKKLFNLRQKALNGEPIA